MLKNKKILIIVEKPSQAKLIQNLEIFKELSLNNEINFHYAHCIVPYYSYKYPNNLKYKELPFIGNLDYKFDLTQYNKFLKENPNSKDSPYVLSKNNLNKEFFLNYEIIILATDQDSTGCYGAYLELEQVLGKNFEYLFKDIYSLNMTNKCLNNEIKNVLTNEDIKKERFSSFHKLVNAGRIKKYFDYNFQINSNILIKEVYKYVFISEYKNNEEFEDNYTKQGFTKYMLLAMLSYFKELKHNNMLLFNIDEFLLYLHKYKGSGKYESPAPGIGSISSRSQIRENLINLQIIKMKDRKTYYFNDKTEKMISLLNKRMFDPDLSYRIKEWCSLDFEIAKEKINNYLQLIFIKQKIKNKYLMF